MAQPIIADATSLGTPSSPERGLFYGTPADGSWSSVGAYLGQINRNDIFDALSPSALKIRFGRFQHFELDDNTGDSFFPLSKFMAYNDEQVASGQPSLFVSAQLGGVERPVYFDLNLGLDANGRPTTPQNTWFRAVNFRDDRFINWWINDYVRPIVLASGLPNQWVGLDNCAFNYSEYGVIGDDGAFHSVTWDAGYPQNEAEFLDAVQYFMQRVKQIAPDLHLICNEGRLSDYSRFQSVYANIDGVAEEDEGYDYIDGSAYRRQELYQKFLDDSWMTAQGKVGLFKWMSLVNDATLPQQLRRAYVHYLLIWGAHSYFDPQFNVEEVPPSDYAGMAQSLGLPVSPTTSTPEPNMPEGYRLYTRQTEGGIVYLNWTGAAKTIVLPPGHSYMDRNGNPVTQITIPDMAADYVLFASA